MQLKLSDLTQAWAAKDPSLVDYIIALSQQTDSAPKTLIRAEALTFKKVLQAMHNYTAMQQKTKAEQYAWRVTQWQLLEAEDAEAPLPERLKLYKILFLLWQDDSLYARHVLLEVIQRIPLVYGAWRALKHIFKASEQRNDYTLLGAIAARLDTEVKPEFSQGTLLYMRRRAWRYLRNLGHNLPAVYPEAASHFLAAYTDQTNWSQTWIANHIFFHDTQAYGWHYFGYVSPNANLLDKRAFKATWQRSPEPLLRLLSVARAEKIRKYACDALKTDFKVVLRDVDPQWLIELANLNVKSPAIDNLIVWFLQNSPKLEQQNFRQLGLHSVVISLLESSDTEALTYAIQYAKAYARDLPVSELLRLALISHNDLKALVQQLINERDPRKDIGLEAWGQLLNSTAYYEFAAAALRKHFGRTELSADWFKARLLSVGDAGFKFAKQYLLELHPLKTLDLAYFQDILTQLDTTDRAKRQVAQFILPLMEQFDLNELPSEFIQLALFHPYLKERVSQWLQNDKIKLRHLPLDFYKALAYEPDWAKQPFIQQLQQSAYSWAQNLSFNTELAAQVRTWLSDVRRFSSAALGFEWLMQLVNREEAEYHDFALQLMTKAFVPADFAPADTEAVSSTISATSIDLAGKSFLFTGKLSTMTRGEAEQKVTDAKGKNAGSVNAKLDYLVIGDEGSPLYGNGRKGSKQVSAEKLIAAGAGLKIISETAFLKMLAGEQSQASEDKQLAGCETLWQMAVAKPDTPISKFAIQYLRSHHPELALRLNERPVDPGAEIPESFITLARVKPLLQHAHAPLRNLGLDFAKYAFARWQPNAADLIALSESKYGDVREFVSKALLDELAAENKSYHLDATQLRPAEVYSFCEARTPSTRQLGMQLIQKFAQFQVPDALFQLTESPDRELRSFAVRLLWKLYKHYATTAQWQPSLPLMPGLSKLDQAKREAAQKQLGTGLPKRPKNLPADYAALQQLLKRWLYELPPGRMSTERLSKTLKPLSASQAKKALIDTFRDVALDDAEFAALVYPLFKNFTRSNGAMEQAACLVAVTRLQASFPNLAAQGV